jgi:hypothetical protein
MAEPVPTGSDVSAGRAIALRSAAYLRPGCSRSAGARPSASVSVRKPSNCSLFLALGGGAYAAINLPKSSVKAKQIAKGAVRSSEVKNRSLLPADFKAGSLPAGERGPQGEPGQPGPGAAKLYFDRGSDDEVVTLGSIGPWTIKAQCAIATVSVPASPQVLIDGPGGADITDNETIKTEHPTSPKCTTRISPSTTGCCRWESRPPT